MSATVELISDGVCRITISIESFRFGGHSADEHAAGAQLVIGHDDIGAAARGQGAAVGLQAEQPGRSPGGGSDGVDESDAAVDDCGAHHVQQPCCAARDGPRTAVGGREPGHTVRDRTSGAPSW